MLWFYLSLLCAFSLATSDALVKKALAAGHNDYLVAWLRLLWSLPVLLGFYLLTPSPAPPGDFYRVALLALPLELVAMLLYVKALKHSPLGLTLPFLSLTPVFLLIVPTLLLGERLTWSGGLGVVLIAVGGYSLHLRQLRQGVLMPLKSIWHERGSRYMIAVALLYSFTATLSKQAIVLSTPMRFAAFYFPLLAVLMAPLALWQLRGRFNGSELRRVARATLLPGLLFAAMLVSHMYAVNLVNVAYMISVKRLSLVIGVIYGHLLFAEAGLAERLFGTTLMVGGVALILLGGS